MGPEYYWMHGMWIFPLVMPIVMVTVLLIVLYLIFGRGSRPPWQDRGRELHYNNPMEILKTRYAKGELSGEEFEKIKKDLLS